MHAQGRDRDAIWDAMKRREVYGTSGHRMLVWFDLLNAPQSNQSLPMGSDVDMSSNPMFSAKVVGSFKQVPGCPDYVVETLEEKRLQKLSLGECYNPSDERYLIDRIEVIKIRPQSFAGEEVSPLIEDPWRTFECAPSVEGCNIEFEDPNFAIDGRDALYYIRAHEQAIATINGGNLRTSFDDQGHAIATDPCFGDYRTDEKDDCQKPLGQQAWSSPIFVDFKQ